MCQIGIIKHDSVNNIFTQKTMLMYVFLCFKKKAQVFTKRTVSRFAITDIQFILAETKKR